MDRVQKANAIYDFKRALRFNAERIKKLSDEEFVQRAKDYLFLHGDEEWKEIVESIDATYRLKFAPYIKVRLQTLGQFRDHCKYFFTRLPVSDDLLFKEKMGVTPEIVHEILPQVAELLGHLTPEQWTEETIKEELLAYITAKGYKN